MFNKRPVLGPSDLNQKMAGKCGTCGTVVECLRLDGIQQAPTPISAAGSWNDLVYTGCHNCGARIPLMPREDFHRLTKS